MERAEPTGRFTEGRGASVRASVADGQRLVVSTPPPPAPSLLLFPLLPFADPQNPEHRFEGARCYFLYLHLELGFWLVCFSYLRNGTGTSKPDMWHNAFSLQYQQVYVGPRARTGSGTVLVPGLIVCSWIGRTLRTVKRAPRARLWCAAQYTPSTTAPIHRSLSSLL